MIFSSTFSSNSHKNFYPFRSTHRNVLRLYFGLFVANLLICWRSHGSCHSIEITLCPFNPFISFADACESLKQPNEIHQLHLPQQITTSSLVNLVSFSAATKKNSLSPRFHLLTLYGHTDLMPKTKLKRKTINRWKLFTSSSVLGDGAFYFGVYVLLVWRRMVVLCVFADRKKTDQS